ncbi:MAG: PAS domain S-box-containing protein [Arenicella sp.]
MEHKNETSSNTTNHKNRLVQRRKEDRAREQLHSNNILPTAEWHRLTPDDRQNIVHQLQVHQVELEEQNEELRVTQLQLEAARLRYFDLYDLAPVGYCNLSEQGVILEANRLVANLLSCDKVALAGQMLSHFILAADQDIYYLHSKKIFDSGQAQTCELRMLGVDNSTFWAQLHSSIEYNAQGSRALRIIINDIGKRKLVETQQALFDEALLKCNIQLECTTADAEKANLAKTDFLSNMSHELRTPLNSILGFAQMLEASTPALSTKQKANIDQILQGSWYLLKLINEILDLALIESGKLSTVMEPVPIKNTISHCLAMIELQAENRNICLNVVDIEKNATAVSDATSPHAGGPKAASCEAFSTETSDSETRNTNVDYYVQADPTRLKQVLINLLSNAIKYNKIGGTVTIKCVEKPGRRMRICIEDTGDGLSPEKLAQLFQPFNRLGQEAGAAEGTGIGLVMAKRLMELMDGDIGVESAVDKGSLFWVELKSTEMS